MFLVNGVDLILRGGGNQFFAPTVNYTPIIIMRSVTRLCHEVEFRDFLTCRFTSSECQSGTHDDDIVRSEKRLTKLTVTMRFAVSDDIVLPYTI